MPRTNPKAAVGEDTMPESVRCAEVMEAFLHSNSGIRGVSLHFQDGEYRLRYDPGQISLVRVKQLSRQLGIDLDRRYERCTLRSRGMSCGDCTAHVTKSLGGTPAVVRVDVNPAAQIISVEYDPREADLPTFERRLRKAGYRAEPLPGTRAAYQASERRDRALRRRMGTLTVLCLAALVTGWVLQSATAAPQAVVLAVFAAAYLAGGFYSSAQVVRELRSGTITVDFLMITAALGAAAIGQWREGAILLFLFSLSNTLEQYVLGRTRRAIESLMDLTPEAAVVRRNGREERLPVEDLRLGDLVVVRPGERIAADGTVRAGRTSVDQSPMTGESIPVEKEIDDAVFAGTLNQEGVIELEVTKLAGDTTLARMVRLVEEAQTERAQSQHFTEWFGQRYTLAVLGAAALTLLVPTLWLGEPFARSFYRAMTVLVVASPCAVVISIPAAILSSIARAARGGVLFKGGAHLEQAAELRAIAFDKTGTLTVGRPQVVDVRSADGSSVPEVLRLAAAAERLSEHPIARAVLEEAATRDVTVPTATDTEAIVGRGLRARVETRWITVGTAELVSERVGRIPRELTAIAARLAADDNTVIFVGDDDRVIGLLAVADTLRETASAAVRDLRELGIGHLVMFTGDTRVVARSIARELDMEFQAELLPEDKLRAIRSLREDHGAIAMVGDGINDAPSLAAADLGISLGGAGTDVALETADVVLMADDLRHLPFAVALARQTTRIIRQNLVFAFGVMGLLLAITYFGELRLPLAVAGHEGSTVLVILNGLRLLLFRRPR